MTAAYLPWLRRSQLGLLVLVLVFAAALPWLQPNPATINIGVFTLMYVGLATAWNIMGGFSGYISLGHAGFFGFGAYALGLLLAHLGVAGGYTPFLLVPLAGLATALFALPVGWVALRTREATFVIVTIAMMFMLQLLAMNLRDLTGGSLGLSFPVPRWGARFFEVPFYEAMLALAVVGLAVAWALRRSKLGLGLLAIRDDEDRAEALGVPTAAFKLAAFALSAGLVGMIGGVYGYYVTYIYPDFVVDPLIGLSMVLMAFLGGMGTLSGPVLGALLLEPAQLWLAYNMGASKLYLLFYAAVFLIVILLLPRGIVPSVTALLRSWRAGRRPGQPLAEAVAQSAPAEPSPPARHAAGSG
jgi:branched-chain amino acid transport system permease protein